MPAIPTRAQTPWIDLSLHLARLPEVVPGPHMSHTHLRARLASLSPNAPWAAKVVIPEKTEQSIWPSSGQPMVFDHPTTYADYYARYPDHIHRMCLAWRCGAQPLEDVEQGLHLYLMTPMRNGRQRLGAYDGTKRGNAVSENAWWSWVNLVLRRQFRHLVDRDNKGGVSGPNIFSVSSWLLDDGGIKPNEDIMSNDDFEKLKFERAPVVDQLLMDRFVAYLETRCPSAMEFFLAIKMCEGDYMEAAYLLDMTETLRARRLKELRSWAGAYMEGMHRPRGARPRIPSIN